jgi:succinylornithine aminotransferase
VRKRHRGFQNAFHGRTLFTVSAGGQPIRDFAPLPPQIQHASITISSRQRADQRQTCAVIVEPMQGEGGVVPAPRFLRGLRELCDRTTRC